MKCALVHSITSPDDFKIIGIADVLNDIKTERYKLAIEALPPATDKKSYTEAKRHLPSWALNGVFIGKVINSGFTESNGLFHIDIDGLSDPKAVKWQLAHDIPEIYALWLSPSGNGLKGLLRIPDDVIHTDSDFKKAFTQIEKYLSVYDVTIDKACKDVRRLCFVGCDADIFINTDAPAFIFDAVKWDFKPAINATPTVKQAISNHADRYINRCCDLILNAGMGNYHNSRLRAGKLAGGFIAAGLINEHEVMQALSDASDQISAQCGDNEQVIQREQKTIYDAIQHGKGLPVELEQYRQVSGGQTVAESKVVYPDFEAPRNATEEEIEQHDFDYEPEPRITFNDAVLPIKHIDTITDYLNASIYNYSPKATRHAALAFICHVVSRKFMSDSGDKCSLMVGNVGATVSQLEGINNSLESLCFDVGLNDSDVRVDRMTHIELMNHYVDTSGSGKLLFMPRELGGMVRSSLRQSSLAIDALLAEITQFHDKSAHIFRAKTKSRVINPVINLYANFSETDLFTFGKVSNNEGLFFQFLTQVNKADDFIFNSKKRVPIADSDSFNALKVHVTEIIGKPSATFIPAIKTPESGQGVIHWTANPRDYAQMIKDSCAVNTAWHGKVMAMFVNLATAITAWNGDSVVTVELANSCASYVCFRISELSESLTKRASDDVAPDVMSRVLSIIHRAGEEGAKEGYICLCCAGYKKLPENEKEDLIRQLVKMKEITISMSDGNNKGKGGRKGRRFFIR